MIDGIIQLIRDKNHIIINMRIHTRACKRTTFQYVLNNILITAANIVSAIVGTRISGS